jgi:hypothetical protein
MKRAMEKAIYLVLGGCGGLIGLLPAANCSRGACAGCYGCAGAGVLMIAVAVINKCRRRGKSGQDHSTQA